jgi:hypothetical protein
VKVAIAYFSLLGSSRKYASWLAADLRADLLEFRKATDVELSKYDTVLICSGTFGSWMPLTGFLRSHWRVLSTKQVVVVAVGSVPADDPSSLQALEAIPDEIRKSISYFKLPCELSLKLWLTGPVSAYYLSKHGREINWVYSRARLDPVIAAVRAIESTSAAIPTGR